MSAKQSYIEHNKGERCVLQGSPLLRGMVL